MKKLNKIDKESLPISVENVLVSVIIATYERDKSLRKALESIMKQTYNNIEIIVVDDNGDFNWKRKVSLIINEINIIHPIVYIQNEKNMGSAEARNIGIRVALGEYITFLDDDDIYLVDKIKNQVEHMIENNSDYSITDIYLYDENDKLIEKRTRQYLNKETKSNLLKYHLLYHMTGTDSMMFKNNYLLKIGGFSPINVGDEFYLMQKAIEGGGEFSYLPVSDIKAYIHTETGGLSSGDSKIKGENELYEYKHRYFNMMESKDIRFIKMRHYAVLAFAEMRRKRPLHFIKYLIMFFVIDPVESILLILKRK